MSISAKHRPYPALHFAVVTVCALVLTPPRRGSIMKDTVDRMRESSSYAAGAGFTFVSADGFGSSVTGRFVRCSGSLSCSTTLRSDL
jgi:hypothetical protein